jgi:hypothetical protein
MTDAVTDGAFQYHCVLDPSLSGRRFQHNFLYAIADLHHLPTVISHCRREEHFLVLAIRVERGFDLIERLNSYQFTWLQVERLESTTIGR